MSDSTTLYFSTRVGAEKKQIPFPVSLSLALNDVLTEVCKKVGVSQQRLSLSTPGGVVLTASDLNREINSIVEEFGTAFEVIDQGLVG